MTRLIVFSHLRWDAYRQRAQQLLSRLARHWNVLYVEAPVRAHGAARLAHSVRASDVEVLTPFTPLEAPAFDDRQLDLVGPLLNHFLRAQRSETSLAWFSTPMAWPLAGLCKPRVVIYDCTGERIECAPLMQEREQALLARADLVLAAGPSLYAAKRKHNANTVCLPSAVDARRFSPARLSRERALTREAAAVCAGIGAPRLGFFGAIDERLDLELIAQLADARADWQIVMAGPLRGIAADALPHRANLHWLGAQPQALLPHLMATWDLCLMPFVLNGRTRFLNPDQTLEYMAGVKPIVSTALPDVVALHGGVVRIAHDAAEFVRACEQVLVEPAHKRSQRISEMLSTVSCACWERSAASVQQLIERELRKTPPTRTPPLRLQPSVA